MIRRMSPLSLLRSAGGAARAAEGGGRRRGRSFCGILLVIAAYLFAVVSAGYGRSADDAQQDVAQKTLRDSTPRKMHLMYDFKSSGAVFNIMRTILPFLEERFDEVTVDRLLLLLNKAHSVYTECLSYDVLNSKL